MDQDDIQVDDEELQLQILQDKEHKLDIQLIMSTSIDQDILIMLSEDEKSEKLLSLKTIHLEYLNIRTIENLELFDNLQVLFLQHNQISEIQNMETLINLEYLSLHHNHITVLHNLNTSRKLKYLDLSNNQIQEIKEMPQSLEILKMEENPIMKQKDIIKWIITHLKYLDELDGVQIRQQERFEALKIFPPELSVYQKHLNQHKMKKMMKFKKLQEMYDPDQLIVDDQADHVEDDDFLTQNSILQMQQQTEDLLHKAQDSKVEQLLVLKQELLEYQQLHESIPAETLKQFAEEPEECAYVYWNLKNFEKAGGSNLSARDIATNLQQTIENKKIKAEILRVHIQQCSNTPITTLKQIAGANNFLDVEFLRDLFELQKDMKELILDNGDFTTEEEVERYVPEKLKTIQTILQKLKDIFQTDDVVQASLVESELVEEFNSTKNNKNEVIAILKTQKKNIEYLHQSVIDVKGKEPMFLNYQQHKTGIIKFDNKLNREVIEIQQLQFGMLVQESEQLNFQFQSYFIGEDFIRKMSQLQLSFSLLINKQIQRKLEIVMSIDQMFAIKWDIDLSLCHYVSECSEGFLYFKMLSPPACYASYSGKQKYEITQFIADYLRIDNILLNWSSNNEIQRLTRINTTVIAIKVKDNSYIKTLLKAYNLFQMDINITQTQPQTQDMRHLYLIKSRMPYCMKFNILSLISQNKLNDFNFIIKLIEYLDSKYRKQPNTIEISEATFQQCLRILSNINQNVNGFQQNQINFTKFKKMYTRTVDEIIIFPKSSQRLAFIRRVAITPSGLLYLQKQPEETSAILRQHYQQMEHFIRVHFEDENQETILQIPYTTQCFYYDLIYPTMKILDKCYTLFTWSSSQLRNGSCWFLDLKGIPYDRSKLIMSIGNFMNLHPEETAKNAARLGQNLSSSFSMELSGQLKILIIDDLKDQQGKLYSDGIGQISRDLIEQIRSNRDNRHISAIQIRYEGAKGVLVLNNDLQNCTIKLRKSMIKYQPSSMVSGLYGGRMEILDFNKFRGGYLNRQIIMLLITLGVPNESFMQLQAEYLNKIQNLQMKDASIYQYFNVEYNSQLQGLPTIQQTVRHLISHNYDDKNNWFLRGVMNRLKERGLLLLRTKTNILVQKAARLIGVLDEFKILKEDEIYCHRVSGPVVVTRNPCLHPGDVRILNAVGAEEIKLRFNSKNPFEEFHHSIVFPQVGEAIPCKIAGGDLDGDIFFVSWDKRLIPKEQVESMAYDVDQKVQKKVIDFHNNNEALHNKDVERMFKIQNMIEFLFSYLNSDVLGKIDNSHLAIADQSQLKAKDPRCSQLAQLHSDAVDFVKHGRPVYVDQKLLAKQWPDYMEKENKQTTYQSKTVIGELYRQIVEIYHEEQEGQWNFGYEQNNLPNIEEQLIKDLNKCQNGEDTIKLVNEQYKQHINIALRTLIHIFETLKGLFLTYSIKNEFEIYSGNFTNFTKGDGLYFKRKLNVENVQKRVITHIIQMKQEVDELLKQDRIYIISLMHLIVSYSPKMELNQQPILNQFMNGLLIELEKEKKWNTLIKDFNTWYRGCTWFLFWKDLLPDQIQENDDETEIFI